jgi:hypothetical protein
MVISSEQRNQVAKHVTRGRESMQQQQAWLLRIAAGFAIENLETVHEFSFVRDMGLRHGIVSGSGLFDYLR